MKTVSIIVPCYNEEQSLPLYFEAVDEVLKDVSDYDVDFILVNDGSSDKTQEVIENLYNTRNDVNYVTLSRNFGQNPALTAGLDASTSDYVIMMDVDLQDPVELIIGILQAFSEGYDIVSPHRTSRETDSAFKRQSAGFFYKFVNKLEGKKIVPENVNCFRGLSRRAVDAIKELPEKDRLLVSEIPLVGFKSCQIDFTRKKRSAGTSKYNLGKMVNYAFDIISSTTVKPLYTPIKVGAIGSACFGVSSVALLAAYITLYCLHNVHYSIVGISTIISFVLFAAFLVIFFIGILGIYQHNIQINTRNRPTYFADATVKKEDKEPSSIEDSPAEEEMETAE